MVELPNPRTARVQALLGALASWVFVFWLVGLPFFASRPYLFIGLFASVVLWLVVIAISLTMKCPHCGKSIAIANRPQRLGPDWKAGRKQFFPIEAVMGKPCLVVCPHCGTSLSIDMGAKSVT
jgi:rRNA maturation protein Nop10